jgi:hypothetical protein
MPTWPARIGQDRRAALFVLALAGVSMAAAALAARVTFGLDGWLWNLDMPKIHYPLAAFYHQALVEGRLPLWEPDLGLGFPLYAEGQIGAFYPPNWILFQFEPLAAMDLSRLLHLAMTGVGTGLLALRLSGSRTGALLAAAAIVLCAATTTKLQWWNMTAAFAWAPWVLLAISARRPPRRGELVAAGVLWGLQALTGHPQTWMLTGLAAGVLLVRRPWPEALGRLLVLGALGVAIGAAQLIPTYMLLGLSNRAEGLPPNELFGNATTVFDVLGVGFANAFALTVDGAWDYVTNWYPDGQFTLLNAGLYLGLPVLALAGVGAAMRRSRRWLALAGVMLAIPVLAAFQPAVWSELPILNGLRSPVRSYMFVSLALIVVASVGVARLDWRRPAPFKWAFLAVATVVVAYLAVVVLAAYVPAAFDQLTVLSWWTIPPEAIEGIRLKAIAALTAPWPFIAEIGLVLVLAILLTRGLPRGAGAVVAALAFVPLVALGPAPNPTRPADELSFADETFVQMLQAENAHRILTIAPPSWYPGMPDQLAAAGVPDIAMFSSLNFQTVDQLVRDLRAEDADGSLRRAVGIDRVVTFGEPCEGPRRAQDVSQNAYACGVDGTTAPPYWIPPEAVSFQSDLAPDATVDPVLAVAEAVPARTVNLSTTRHEIVIDAPSEGYVWFDSAWWPSRRVTVDGAEAADYFAMGGHLVLVPGGTHTVVAELTLREVQLGAFAGVVAFAVAIGWAWLPARRRRGSRGYASRSR